MKDKDEFQYSPFRHGRAPHKIMPPAKRCARCRNKFADEILRRVKGKLMCPDCQADFEL